MFVPLFGRLVFVCLGLLWFVWCGCFVLFVFCLGVFLGMFLLFGVVCMCVLLLLF